MNRILGLCLVAVTVCCACKKEPPAAAPAPIPAPPVAAPKPATPAATAPDESVPVARSLPEQRFKDLPGWFAIATSNTEATTHGWTPQHPDAEVVIFGDLWDAVPKGTKLAALSGEGPVELTYLSAGEHRYGCEENTQRMAGFDAPKKVPEGVVWILPSADPGAATLPIVAAPSKAGDESRTWKVAGLQFTAKRKAQKHKGVFEVQGEGEALIHKLDFEKGYMEGAEKTPLDLSDPSEIGVPFPIAAFRVSAKGPIVVVLNSHGYEGEGFRFVVKEGEKAPRILEETEGLYLCAF